MRSHNLHANIIHVYGNLSSGPVSGHVTDSFITNTAISIIILCYFAIAQNTVNKTNSEFCLHMYVPVTMSNVRKSESVMAAYTHKYAKV